MQKEMENLTDININSDPCISPYFYPTLTVTGICARNFSVKALYNQEPFESLLDMLKFSGKILITKLTKYPLSPDQKAIIKNYFEFLKSNKEKRLDLSELRKNLYPNPDQTDAQLDDLLDKFETLSLELNSGDIDNLIGEFSRLNINKYEQTNADDDYTNLLKAEYSVFNSINN